MSQRANEDWLLNCVALIKRAPGFWVPTESAIELHMFLLGYTKARHDLGVPDYGPTEKDLLEDFEPWLRRRLGNQRRLSWADYVAEADPSASNVTTFVSLFEEFLASLGRALPEPDVEKWAGETEKAGAASQD
jgi:hypothetical protein